MHARAHGRRKVIGKRSVPFPEIRGEFSAREVRGFRFRDASMRPRRPGNADGRVGATKPAAALPGIEWAIEDTVNIQPGFPVATVRRKNGARGAREDIDAGVRRLPHSAPTSKLGVYTWQSRHFGVSTRLRGFIFTHAHGDSTGAPRDDDETPRAAQSVGDARKRRSAGSNDLSIRQKSRLLQL